MDHKETYEQLRFNLLEFAGMVGETSVASSVEVSTDPSFEEMQTEISSLRATVARLEAENAQLRTPARRSGGTTLESLVGRDKALEITKDITSTPRGVGQMRRRQRRPRLAG